MKSYAFILTFPAVTLMAFQIIKTQLQVTVRNELGNTEAGATVMLFEKEEDYRKETNPAAQAMTDAKGIARFKDLKAIPYYIIVRKDDRDNSGGGEMTGKLEGGRINKITVVIQ
jgi:hypothetical protein